jgi:tetrapyrrole methylase family protein/MazG family protein
VGALHHPQLNPDQPAILAQVYSLAVASDVKLTLMNQYPEDHPVTLIHGAGTPDQALERVPLYEIDRSEKVSHLTSLYVPPLARASSFERFQETIAHLRAPEGCPWDQKQTHASLRKYLLEETYEVLDAIDRDDTAALREELGDLLLQVVLHSQIAVDDGEFRMADIVESINNKIIRRHPHVWGDVKVNDSEEVKANWDALKRQEKAAHAAARADSNGGSGSADPDASSDAQSILASVPKALPALALAEKYSTRTIRVGFDWPDADAVLAKVLEEIDEVKAATTPEERAAELGDVLFSVVNWGLKFGVDAETALRETCIRFAGRFAYVERKAGYDVAKLTMDQMQAYWDEAKASGL